MEIEASRERQKRLAALRGKELDKDSEMAAAIDTTMEEKAEQLLEQVIGGGNEEFPQGEAENEYQAPKVIPLEELAPRRANWDLKEGLQSKLDILDERTSDSIMEIIKERLKS